MKSGISFFYLEKFKRVKKNKIRYSESDKN
jgi:hypothetical protein